MTSPSGFDPPDWNQLVGGDQEANWLADRDLKLDYAGKLAAEVSLVYRELQARDAVFHCSPLTLTEIPFAATLYVSLAGFSLKTLGNIRRAPANLGLDRNPKTVVDGLSRGRTYPPQALAAFSTWVNAEIDRLFPQPDHTDPQALATVLLILAGA